MRIVEEELESTESLVRLGPSRRLIFNELDSYKAPIGDTVDANKYAFVGGNPINRKDPTGQMSLGDILLTTGIIASLAAILLPAVHGAYTRAYHVTAAGNREGLMSAIFHGEATWDDFKRVFSGFNSGAQAGEINLLDTLTFRQIDSLHDYRNQLWKSEGLDQSWVGTTANGFAWAGTGLLYSAALVYAWGAARLPTMDVSVTASRGLPYYFHFQFGANGTWYGATAGSSLWAGDAWVVGENPSGPQITGLPVMNPMGVLVPADYAYNCATAVMRAIFRGWGGW